MDIISSKKMYNAYLSGAKEVMAHKTLLNKINVFPVADGDTGTNLYSTMNSVIRESIPDDSIKTTMVSIADSALRGARGNSGIIFAEYLHGLSMETNNEQTLSITNFIQANLEAVKYAYKAITEPVEGTIITVIKDWANALHKLHKQSSDFIDLIAGAYNELEKSVVNTTNQLRILKQNSVVDSGAKGFALFIKGFLDHLRSGKEELSREDFSKMTEDPTYEEAPHSHLEIVHRYCTEAMIEAENILTEDIKRDLKDLGDSLLVASNGRKAKIHLHTDDPPRVFEILQRKAKITYQKVDDMKIQNEVMENRLHDIALVTDSIADIPKEYIDQNQIHVIPLNILLGETNYLDKLTIQCTAVLDYVESHTQLPTSSQPDYKTVENLFSFLSSYYKSILVITVAKPLSGTFSLISKVASDFKDRFPEIYVIDSKLNSGAQGLLVMRAVEYIQQGLQSSEIVTMLTTDLANGKILVNVKTIDNMIKSGRLSTRAGKIAKFVHLKPIVSLDETGKGNLAGIAFSFPGSLKKTISLVKKAMKQKSILCYSLVHVNNLAEATQYAKVFTQLIGKPPSFIEEVSSITSVAAGKGTIAISYITD